MPILTKCLSFAGIISVVASSSLFLSLNANAHSFENAVATTYQSPREYNPQAKFYVLGGLFTYSHGSHINVRTGPGTHYSARHYGLPGDRVIVLNEAHGRDGYRWWYLQFKNSGAKGWIREDFVAIPNSGLREIAAQLR